jgi:hypothetical protein
MGAISLFAADWHPVDPADLALKQSKTDPNADAEGLFREVRIANEQHGVNYANNTVSEYVRIKIFTERGKDFANVQIPYFLHSNIFNVEGRTIHPDGSIVELSKDSIFDKVLQKRGFNIKMVSFALPAVQPGSIIAHFLHQASQQRLLFLSRHALHAFRLRARARPSHARRL